MELTEWQNEAIRNLSSGKVLYGGVGSGKTAAVLGYWQQNEEYRHIYVLTTARKRDEGDWIDEAANLGIDPDFLTIDSWNNIGKYVGVTDAFFVFDEQRLVGRGSWVKSFYKIVENGNHWVLLSATPGDTWMDYAAVFIANGYFKDYKDFVRKHVVYKHYLKYPVVDYYFNEEKLEEYRNEILVEMPMFRATERILNWWPVSYDKEAFDMVYKKRWNVFTEEPIKNITEWYYTMRKVVNLDDSRLDALWELHRWHPRLIVFYSFDYELEVLRTLYGADRVFEWNGHRKHKLSKFEHQPSWIYLVQYTAGAEAWNCTSTDAMVLFSLNYSYKVFEQVQGRIDRMDTPFRTLYYYIFLSDSWIDAQIKKAIDRKEVFNERKAAKDVRFDVVEDEPWELELKEKYGRVA